MVEEGLFFHITLVRLGAAFPDFAQLACMLNADTFMRTYYYMFLP